MQNRYFLLRAKYEAIIRNRETQSELSVEAFCKKHEITPYTYFYWNKKLRIGRNRFSSRAKFIPVTIKNLPQQNRVQTNYEFRFTNGAVLSVSDELENEKLSVLIRTVAMLSL